MQCGWSIVIMRTLPHVFLDFFSFGWHYFCTLTKYLTYFQGISLRKYNLNFRMESFVVRQIYSSTSSHRRSSLRNIQTSHWGLLGWRAQSLFNVQNLRTIVKFPGKLEIIWARNYTIVYRPPNQWFFPRALLIILGENSFILKSLKLGNIQCWGKRQTKWSCKVNPFLTSDHHRQSFQKVFKSVSWKIWNHRYQEYTVPSVKIGFTLSLFLDLNQKSLCF